MHTSFFHGIPLAKGVARNLKAKKQSFANAPLRFFIEIKFAKRVDRILKEKKSFANAPLDFSWKFHLPRGLPEFRKKKRQSFANVPLDFSWKFHLPTHAQADGTPNSTSSARSFISEDTRKRQNIPSDSTMQVPKRTLKGRDTRVYKMLRPRLGEERIELIVTILPKPDSTYKAGVQRFNSRQLWMQAFSKSERNI